MKRRALFGVVATLGVLILALLAWYLLGGKAYPVTEYPTRILGEWLIQPKDNANFLIVWVFKADGTGEIKHYKRPESLEGRRYSTEDDKRDNFFFRPWATQVFYQPCEEKGDMEGVVIDKWRIAGRSLITQSSITGFSSAWTYTIAKISPSDLNLDLEFPAKITIRLKRKALFCGH